MMRPSSEKGFTLVELAISLVVIGLIIGGVLRGKEMIHNAQISSTMSQIKSFDAAAATFRDTYGALPGDLKDPQLRLPNCTTFPCNLSGNANGKIDWTFDMGIGGDDFVEAFNFFPHLQKAGLIKDPFGNGTVSSGTYPPTPTSDTHSEFSPKMALKGVWAFYVIYADPTRGQGAPQQGMNDIHYYSIFDLSALEAGAMDKKLDDFNGYTGDVVVVQNPVTPATRPCTDADGVYEEKLWPDYRCVLWVQTNF